VELRIIGVGAGGVAIAGVGAGGAVDRSGGPPAANPDSVRKILVVVATIILNAATVIVKMINFVLAIIYE